LTKHTEIILAAYNRRLLSVARQAGDSQISRFYFKGSFILAEKNQIKINNLNYSIFKYYGEQ